MKKEKETSQEQPSYAFKVRKHRSKKEFLVIDGLLMIEDDRLIQGKRSQRSSAHPPIRLKIEISDEDLSRLSSYAVCYENEFYSKFSNLLVSAVREAKTGARGKHKGRETSVSWIKREARFLHALFSYINDSDINPDYYRDLIESIPSDEREMFRKLDRQGRDLGYDPILLTAYHLEKSYGTGKLTTMKLKPFYSGTDSAESFNNTYIQPGRKESEAYFKEMLKAALIKHNGVKYLCRKGEKGLRYDFREDLARRSDMMPCDEFTNLVDIGPIGKKNPYYKEALAILLEEIRAEPLFQMTF